MNKLPQHFKREPTRVVRFPGITFHAQKMGVTRIHLWRVLVGERRSPRLEAYAKAHGLLAQKDALAGSGCQAPAKGKFFASGSERRSTNG